MRLLNFLNFSLSPKKVEVVAEINKDIAQIFFATMFIGPIVLKTIDWPLSILGLVMAISFWSISLLLTK